MPSLRLALCGALLLLSATPLYAQTPEVTPDPSPENSASIVRIYLPDVVATTPHDPAAFTQGLLWFLPEADADAQSRDDEAPTPVFYESTGLYGQSTLRAVDIETGEVLRSVSLDEAYFAEGLALVPGEDGAPDRLIQLTWREGEAFVYNREDFTLLDTFTYEGEGWGLCYDGEALYHSDGTPLIQVRDPDTFDVLETYTVTLEGEPVAMLNELECVGESVYANIWQTDFIVRFDKATGTVNGLVDARLLYPAEDRPADADVLNGIAYNPQDETFYLTGKRWPLVFEVRLVDITPDIVPEE